MELTYGKAVNFDLTTLTDLFNDAFTDYVGGEIHFTSASFAQFLAQDEINLSLSDIALHNEIPIGFAFVARRGWTSRLAAMGVAQAFQEQGVGKALLDHSLEKARSRGDQAYTLECIEQNPRGLRLYRGSNFQTIRRLLSFKRGSEERPLSPENELGQTEETLDQTDIASVARLVTTYGAPDLPWQISGPTLTRYGPPNLAFRLGSAYAVITSPNQETIALRNFLVLPQSRRKGNGFRLLKALLARYPTANWMIPALCPEEFGGFFERAGFSRYELSQIQMIRDL
jgi:GNAT superfamily N-acetyltransferase